MDTSERISRGAVCYRLRRSRVHMGNVGLNEWIKIRETHDVSPSRDCGAYRCWDRDGHWDTIGSLIDLFEPQECANYFAAAGYDPD